MKTLIVIASRDPKLLVKGIEHTKILSGQQWFEGTAPRWQAFCRTKNLNQVKILLKDQGVTILEG
jgi:hypothetical protein